MGMTRAYIDTLPMSPMRRSRAELGILGILRVCLGIEVIGLWDSRAVRRRSRSAGLRWRLKLDSRLIVVKKCLLSLLDG